MMASLKSAMKGAQKTHRERGQLSKRKHLGHLEKHKDYVLRAKDFHRKQKTIKHLKQKAVGKNPDEFYFQMIRGKTDDGVHKQDYEQNIYTKEQIKLMKTQDLNYLNLKERIEAKKIEKMKEDLHFTELADRQKRSHIFFVDSKAEERSFDAAKQMDTLPNLLDRTHNIPRLDTLHQVEFQSEKQNSRKQQTKAYKELEKRIKRKTQLQEAREGLVLQRQLMGKGTVKKKRCKDGRPKYQWKRVRKS